MLSRDILKKEYWDKQLTREAIAKKHKKSEAVISKLIKEYGLLKRKNGVKLRGKRGYVMPKEEREKHHFQPHAKRVVSIDPVTFEKVKVYRSLASTEEDGFISRNVRRAMNTGGVSRGFLWAREGFEEVIVRVAKRRGIEEKLRRLSVKKPKRSLLEKLYLKESMTAKEIGEKLGISKGAIAKYLMDYGLSKKKTIPVLTPKILKEELLSMSIEEVAKKYNRKVSTIKAYKGRWLKEEKICNQKR